MFVYAGIDEAGYGPMFGPLVIARSIFICPPTPAPGTTGGFCDTESGGETNRAAATPDLWELLKAAVCRKASDKQRRIAVDDSKKLYTPAAGLRHLERAVLAFASAPAPGTTRNFSDGEPGKEANRTAGVAPAHIDQWLDAVGYDGDSRSPHLSWYGCAEHATPLPTTLDPGLLAIAQSQLARALADTGVQVHPLSAAVVYEDRFNRMVQATRSKSRCEWTFIAGHLTDIWRQFASHHPHVVIDRQGGRSHYHDPLSLCFPDAKVHILEESPDVCRYELVQGDQKMTVSFETQSEQRHLPVALASMTAKYTRELLMGRFNAFWQSHDPSLKPTAGYVADGRRFLQDIEPLMRKLNIPHDQLIRCK